MKNVKIHFALAVPILSILLILVICTTAMSDPIPEKPKPLTEEQFWKMVSYWNSATESDEDFFCYGDRVGSAFGAMGQRAYLEEDKELQSRMVDSLLCLKTLTPYAEGCKIGALNKFVHRDDVRSYVFKGFDSPEKEVRKATAVVALYNRDYQAAKNYVFSEPAFQLLLSYPLPEAKEDLIKAMQSDIALDDKLTIGFVLEKLGEESYLIELSNSILQTKDLVSEQVGSSAKISAIRASVNHQKATMIPLIAYYSEDQNIYVRRRAVEALIKFSDMGYTQADSCLKEIHGNSIYPDARELSDPSRKK